MAKTKLRWEFPPLDEIHEQQIFIAPKTQQLLPSPIVVRPCLHGYDEQGILRKVLYCSRDVRFFVHYPDGWHKQLPCTNRVRRGKKNKSPKAGGGFDTAYMRHFGSAKCYRLIAYAFCEWPEEAKTDPLWYKHFEVDHLNGDHSDNSPENLRWLTSIANRAWSKRQNAMRKLGLDLRRIPYNLLRQISDLTDQQFAEWLIVLPHLMDCDERPMTIETINDDIRQGLNNLTT